MHKPLEQFGAARQPLGEQISEREAKTLYGQQLRAGYAVLLKSHLGERYEPGRMDCTQLVLKSISAARSGMQMPLSSAERQLLVNGGRIAERLNANGFGFAALHASEIARSPPEQGTILLRITRANGSGEIEKWHAAGDVAICKGPGADWQTIPSKQEALQRMASGESVFLTHHLVSIVEGGTSMMVLHATSDVRKQVVMDLPEKYFSRQPNLESLFIPVSPEQLFPMPAEYGGIRVARQ